LLCIVKLIAFEMIQLYKIFQKKMVDPFQMEIAQQRKRNGENKTKTKRWLLNCFCVYLSVCLSVCLSIGVYKDCCCRAVCLLL
jgi:hypothetical protein